MSNLDYMTIPQYVESQSKIIGKIAVYDNLIEKMEAQLLVAIESSHFGEIEMDDSMMRVRTRYRNIGDMQKAMEGFITLRNYYKSKANGRVIRFVGGKL